MKEVRIRIIQDQEAQASLEKAAGTLDEIKDIDQGAKNQFKKNNEEYRSGLERRQQQIKKLESNIKMLERAQKSAHDPKAISAYNKVIDENRKKIKLLSGDTKKVSADTQQYEGALNQLSPALGGVTSGIKRMTAAGLAFIASPIGLVLAGLALALGAVISYFKGTEEGQEKLTKITAVASAVWGKFQDIVTGLGKAIVGMFENPIEAAKSFGKIIQTFVMNRIRDLLSGIRGLGNAISLLFQGKFSEAGDAAGKAFGDLHAAINPVAGAIRDNKDAIDEFIDGLEESAKRGKEIGDLLNAIYREETRLIRENAELERKTSLARLKSREQDLFTLSQQIDFLEQANDAIVQQSKNEVALAKMKLRAHQLEMQNSENRREDYRKEAELQAAVLQAETRSMTQRRRLVRELNTLRKQQRDEEIKQEEERLSRLSDISKAEAELEIQKLKNRAKNAETLEEQFEFEREIEEERAKFLATAEEKLAEGQVKRREELLEEIKFVNETELLNEEEKIERLRELHEQQAEMEQIFADERRLFQIEQEKFQEELDQAEIERIKKLNEEKEKLEADHQHALDDIRHIGVESAERTFDALGALAGENAELQKAFLAFQKIKNIAEVIMESQKANAAATAAAAPGLANPNPIVVANTGRALARAISLNKLAAATSVAAIMATSIPEFRQAQGFFKGTAYVTGPGGIDNVPAMLTKGEAVIPKGPNSQYHDEVRSLIDGTFPSLMLKKWIMPALNGGGELSSVIDYDQLRNIMSDSMSNAPFSKLNIDQNGFSVYQHKQGNRMRYLNRRYAS